MARPKKSLITGAAIEPDGLTPQQRFLRNAENVGSKIKGISHSTGATVDSNPIFIVIPDLGRQWALGRVGYTCDRIKYVLAAEGSSKTSALLYECNLVINAGGLATLVEWEHAIDRNMIENYIDNPAGLVIKQADSLESGLRITLDILEEYAAIDPEKVIPKIIGADSIGGGVMEKVFNDDYALGSKLPGGAGGLMAEGVGMIANKCASTKTFWHVIGQAREEINIGAFGGPPKPYWKRVIGKGGKALPFHATYFEVLQPGKHHKDGDSMSGFEVRSFFRKNKRAIPFRSYIYDVKFGIGIDPSQHTMDLLAIGEVGGMKCKMNRFWCPEIGIPETSKMPPHEIYPIVHLPEHIGHFQEALGIRADLGAIVASEEEALILNNIDENFHEDPPDE